MKEGLRLIFMRHGHSPMSAPSDHQRALSALGLTQAGYTGRRLADWPEVWTPELILVSDAQRTQETFKAFSAAWERLNSARVEVSRALYLASAEQWRLTLARRSEERVIMCLGHNPGISDLIGHLSGEWVSLEVGEAVGLSIKGQSRWEVAMNERWALKGRVRPIDDGAEG